MAPRNQDQDQDGLCFPRGQMMMTMTMIMIAMMTPQLVLLPLIFVTPAWSSFQVQQRVLQHRLHPYATAILHRACRYDRSYASMMLLFAHSREKTDMSSSEDIDHVSITTTYPTHPLYLNNNVNFLGAGPDAIVRLGCVLVAPAHNTHHFYRQAVILIFAMGGGGDDDYWIRGLLLDHPTPFTLSEMMNLSASTGSRNSSVSGIAHRTIFRGGDQGADGVILLHNQRQWHTHGSAVEIVPGLYHGGWDAALQSQPQPLQRSNSDHNDADTATGTATATDTDTAMKILFNYLEFTETQLEQMLLDDVNENHDDAWISLDVPHAWILSNDYRHSHGSSSSTGSESSSRVSTGSSAAWAQLRNLYKIAISSSRMQMKKRTVDSVIDD